MYKLPDFLSFSNLFSNFNLQIGLVHLLQRLMIKTLKRKIQFSNDKDMKRVFLLPSVINFQELNASKSTKSSHVKRVWSYFGWRRVGRGRRYSIFLNKETKLYFHCWRKRLKYSYVRKFDIKF